MLVLLLVLFRTEHEHDYEHEHDSKHSSYFFSSAPILAASASIWATSWFI